jgi:hypothetical protein
MLKGSLDDFTLSDIFRLLSFTKKTGKLKIARGAGDGRVFFRDGEVYFAQSSIKREALGQKLIRAGALTESALMRALDLNAQTGERVGEILLRDGSISEEQLAAGVRGQIEDAVFDLLRWEIGDFEFESHERFVVEIPISVSVENLIMEASRRLDELQTIQKKIPSTEVVLAVAPTPPEGAREINITPDEWRLLVLVDSNRTVGDICRAANLDEFTGFRTLYGLISSGLVDVASLGPGPPPSPVEPLPLAPADQGVAAPPESRNATVATDPRPADAPGVDGGTPDPLFGFLPSDAAAANDGTGVVVEDANFPFADFVEADVGVAVDDAAGAVEAPGADPLAPDFPAPADASSDREQDTFLTDILNGETLVEDASERVSQSAVATGASVPAEDDEIGADTDDPTPARVDRAAVVRELAGLFTDEDRPARRPRPAPDSEAAPEEGAGQPEKRRVEDDEEINKGLIGRIIDGVKGM